jgi:hypothetical protein
LGEEEELVEKKERECERERGKLKVLDGWWKLRVKGRRCISV